MISLPTMHHSFINRNNFSEIISKYLKSYPVVAIVGPRQCGKTTLTKLYSQNNQNIHYFDLENQTDLARLKSPLLALENLEGLIIIDKIQFRPDLFPTLRVLADNKADKQQYLILGSASGELMQQSSESLAGRIAYIELTPFSYGEVKEYKNLWIRGGFPLSYLAKDDEASFDWRQFYIETFLQKDLPNLGIKIPPATLRRFWSMLAHYHGNIINFSEIARSFGTSDTTIKRYLDILTSTFMIRQLQPWHQNIKKRQVKAPKIYFRDSGLLHSLLEIENESELQKHPKIGASWEGFALEEITRALKVKNHQCSFWATHSGAELDLLIVKKGKKLGFEFKYSDHPKITKSMQIALEDLELDELKVVYPGKTDFPLSKKIEAIGLENYLQKMNIPSHKQNTNK